MKQFYLLLLQQFISIKNGNLKFLLFKIYIFLSFFTGLLILLFTILIRPIFLIRFGKVHVERIGNLSANLEIYFSERDIGINIPDVRHFDILFCSSLRISNQYLLNMWSRNKTILPFLLGVHFRSASIIISIISGLLPFLKIHLIENLDRDVDINNAIERTSTHLNFTKSEISTAISKLDKNNINISKIVLLCVRDDAYLSKIDSANDWDYHKYRDSEIEDYVSVSEFLAEEGFFVFRMGVKVNKRLMTKHPGVIDYAFSNLRSEFMDIYLSSICTFTISNGTGIDALSWACFRNPMILVSRAPFGYLSPLYSKVILLSKIHVSKESGEKLSIFDIYSNNLAFLSRTKDFEGFELLPNEDSEIKDAVIQMLRLIGSKWELTNNEKSFQNLFRNIFIEELQNHLNIKILKSDLKLMYSSSFLNNNHSWFLN